MRLRTLEGWEVEVLLSEAVSAVAPTRVTLKSGRELKAHTLVWGAGLQAHPLAKTWASGSSTATGSRSGPISAWRRTRRSFAVGDMAWITDTKSGDVLPQLGSVALQAGQHAGENIARRLAGKPTEPFAYHDKGTMATIGRGAAVIQFPHGRTMKGRTASLAWGAVHLALLSTGEDRTKAVLDWVWAGFTHERGGRTVVGSSHEPSERLPSWAMLCDSPLMSDALDPLFTLATSSELLPARSQMAFTLGFHIILACLGVGFPAMMLIANYIGLRRRTTSRAGAGAALVESRGRNLRGRRGDRHRALVRVRAVLAGVHQPLREVFGVLFTIEGIFFFLEAIFLDDLHFRLEAPSAAGRTSGPGSRLRSAASAGPSRLLLSTHG